MQIFINPPKSKWRQLLQRPTMNTQSLMQKVAIILKDVQIKGDKEVKKYASQFDGVHLTTLKVSPAEIKNAAQNMDEDLKNAIEIAKNNITKFHLSQKEISTKITTTPGVVCWRKSVAIQKVGLYIPGGTAPLFSTLLMLGIPATIAGCSQIVVYTPPDKNGKINPAILYVAQKLGIKNIYKVGGVQAIAAMAFGTESLPKVDKIFGPGNQYVTCAKQLVNLVGVPIDMPAGPSEVAVYADDTCHSEFVAADLLSQAEHGIDSQVLLIAQSKFVAQSILQEVQKQLQKLSRKNIAETVLQNSKCFVVQETQIAFDLINEYAPEHLIIASNDAQNLSQKVINAGSVFIGHYTPESAGDYASGTNHTLPTHGFAKAYSGISVDSFVKKITFQQINKTGLKNIANAVSTMAAAEGLDAHKNAVTVRLK